MTTKMTRRASLLLPFGLAGLVGACATAPVPLPPADANAVAAYLEGLK